MTFNIIITFVNQKPHQHHNHPHDHLGPDTGQHRQGRIPPSSPRSGKTAFSGERFILVLVMQEKVHIFLIAMVVIIITIIIFWCTSW